MPYGDFTKCVAAPWGWWRWCAVFEYNVHGTLHYPAYIADRNGHRARSDHWWAQEALSILNGPACANGSYLAYATYAHGHVSDVSNACATDHATRIIQVPVLHGDTFRWHVITMDYLNASGGVQPVAADYVTRAVYPLGGTPWESDHLETPGLAFPTGYGNTLYNLTRADYILGLFGLTCP